MGRGKSARPDELGTAITAVIADLRTAAGLSERALSRATGVTQGRLNDIFNGEQAWTLTELRAVCEHFGRLTSSIVREAEQAQPLASIHDLPLPPFSTYDDELRDAASEDRPEDAGDGEGIDTP